MRLYFYQNGQELTDHPANGLQYMGRGHSIAKFGRSTVHDFIEVRGRDGKVYSLKPSAFDGPVKVKEWGAGYGPEERYVEWWGFASHDDAVARGAESTGRPADEQPDDGRGIAFKGWAPWSEYLEKLEA